MRARESDRAHHVPIQASLQVNPLNDRRSSDRWYSRRASPVRSDFVDRQRPKSLCILPALCKTQRTRFTQGFGRRPERAAHRLHRPYRRLLSKHETQKRRWRHPTGRRIPRLLLGSSLCSDERTASPESAFTISGIGVQIGRNAQSRRHQAKKGKSTMATGRWSSGSRPGNIAARVCLS